MKVRRLNKLNQRGFAVEMLLLVVILVAIIGVGTYVLVLNNDDSKVNSLAKEYVGLVADGDYDDALELSDAEKDQEESVKSLLESLDSQVGSDDYEIDSTEVDGDDATVRLIVDGDSDKTIRLEMKKIDGEWLVVSVVFDLGSSNDTTAPQESTTTQQTTAPTACLPAAALDAHWRFSSGWVFYFKADSNELEDFGASHNGSEIVAGTEVQRMKQFYDDNQQYNFSFTIDVSLYQATGSDSDVELAKKRAGVVAYNMNLAGIPLERIRFGKAVSGGNPDSAEFANQSRTAEVSINSSCDALSSPEDFNKDNVSDGR